ncbi:PIN-like domain-containing protein [Streptomyces iakyrus]|uniref:PIN-like domain-containing protein n=1 Tax=Streptomyces iakyrus TaxID=68219 RepID=UPI0036F9E0E9
MEGRHAERLRGTGATPSEAYLRRLKERKVRRRSDAVQGPGDDLPLIRQYRDWLQGSPPEDSPERPEFFTHGTVVLDTNVLLSLYEYTPAAREQVINALKSVQKRLWLPHQVGLEFVRGRHRVIAERAKALKDAPGLLNRKLGDANRAVVGARQFVQELLVKYAWDTEASDSLAAKISSQAVDALLSEWKKELISLVQGLKDHDLVPASVEANDPVLPQVAELFGPNIAEPPDPAEIRRRVDEASSYRFPNEIPPGFSDSGKGTPLAAAGDFLLWEEVVEFIAASPERKRLLFVSRDTKEDWYEPEELGRGRRPWPSLASELRMRAGAELRIETPGQFYRGVNRFLDAEIADETYEEIDRAAESADEVTITELEAPHMEPPSELVLSAYSAAGLHNTSLPRELLPHLRNVLNWWLIGVTAQLERRPLYEAEPRITVSAAARSASPPDPEWLPGNCLRLGEWPYQSSSWIAPWFAHIVNIASPGDRKILQRLAAQQLDSKASD